MNKSGEILVVIPARGGSKRLPRKNVLLLAGKPLISWTIEAALEAGLNARIVVSSDDEEVLAIAKFYAPRGIVAIKRPSHLATDNASTVDVIIDAINMEREAGCSPTTIVLLQPTSPLRAVDDIHAALKVYYKAGRARTVVSVCEVDHPTAWIGTVEKDDQLVGVNLSGKRSQDYEKEYRLNGAVYVAAVDTLMSARTFYTERVSASIMPRERSLDIDEEVDFKCCESILLSKIK